MKALEASYLKLFTSNQREKERAFQCSLGFAHRQETSFIVHQKCVRNGFCLALSFHPKCIRPASAISSAQANVESEEIQTISSDQPKTVHVRFKLHKECAFGQQFLIVGDDPVLGLWDPSEGVPLNWSEGHVWTAELDIPVRKVIRYKFILKGNMGTILWQPGPDRILETWETDKILYASEDWDNPELQNIVEEDFVDDVNEESLVSSDLSIVAEDLNQSLVENGDNAITKVEDSKDCSVKTSAIMVSENISDGMDGQNLSLSDKGSRLVSVTDEKRDETRLVLDEGIPVLVSGLVPSSTDEIELEDLDKVENTVVEDIISSDETKDSTEPELKDEHISTEASEVIVGEKKLFYSEETITQLKDDCAPASPRSATNEEMVDEKKLFYGEETTTQLKDEHDPDLLHSTDASEMTVDDKQRSYGEEQIESDVLESDVQWGRRTLQKFLANLGFI